jgi:hypothetical protein
MQSIGERKSCLIDTDRATEFTGDDVDQYSELVDLGSIFEFVRVEIPTITSSAVTLYIQEDGDEDTVPKPLHGWYDADGDATVAIATTAATTAICITFKDVWARYVRVRATSDQAADRTFYLKGFNRAS